MPLLLKSLLTPSFSPPFSKMLVNSFTILNSVIVLHYSASSQNTYWTPAFVVIGSFSVYCKNLPYSCNTKGYTSRALAVLVRNASGQPEKVSVNTNRYRYSPFPGSSVKSICRCCPGPLPFPT